MRASSRARSRDRNGPRHRSRCGVSVTGRHVARPVHRGRPSRTGQGPVASVVVVLSVLLAAVAVVGSGPGGTSVGELRLAKKAEWSAASSTFCDRHPHARRCRGTTSPSPDPTTPAATDTASATSTPTSTSTAGSTPSETTTSPSTTSSPTSTTSSPTSSTCTDPAFVTSSPDAGWSNGGYYVHNNMWNASGYQVSQTLSACAYDSWYVTATADNSSGDGAVKTYPNVHKDYHDWGTGAEPRLSSFNTIKSTFAATSPHVGIYDVAYDIWLNGVPGQNEIMIWTDNYRQVPSGSVVASDVSVGGGTWDVYATSSNGYIAFVPNQPMTQGTLDLKAMLDWLVSRGRISSSSTLGQICYGVEVVSTDGKPATFTVSDFSISTS